MFNYESIKKFIKNLTLNRNRIPTPGEPLRQLENVERMLFGIMNCMHQVYLLDTELDLVENRDLVLKAVKEWSNKYALLRCRVGQDNFQSPPYFTFCNPKVLARFKNVQFLYYRPKTNNESDFKLWTLIQERQVKLMNENYTPQLGNFAYIHI